MSLPAELPGEKDYGPLYDLLQERFGLGTYDDAAGRMPWHTARMGEVSRLKALCRQRRATPRQVAIAAWYAQERGIQVRVVQRLFALIPEAMRAYNLARAEQARASTQEELGAAVAEATAAGQTDWVDRLLRAAPTEAESLLKEWRAR